MRTLQVTGDELLKSSHGEQLSHRVIDEIRTAVGAGVLGVGVYFVCPEAFADGVGKFEQN